MSGKQEKIKYSLELQVIEWLDSAQPQPSWQFIENYEYSEAVRCSSVGWIVHEDEDVIGLAPNLGELNSPSEQISGVIHIPVCCITRRVVIAEKALS